MQQFDKKMQLATLHVSEEARVSLAIGVELVGGRD